MISTVYLFFLFAVMDGIKVNLISKRNGHHGPTYDEFIDLKGEKLLICIGGFIPEYKNAHLRNSAHV